MLDQVSGMSDQVLGVLRQVLGVLRQVPGMLDQLSSVSDQVLGMVRQVQGMLTQVSGMLSQVSAMQCVFLSYPSGLAEGIKYQLILSRQSGWSPQFSTYSMYERLVQTVFNNNRLTRLRSKVFSLGSLWIQINIQFERIRFCMVGLQLILLILLIWTNVPRTNVAWTNVVVTVLICIICSQDPLFKV